MNIPGVRIHCCKRFRLTADVLLIAAMVFGPAVAVAEQGVLDQAFQAPIELYEKANEVTHKSEKGYKEAIQDAPPAEVRDAPWSRQDLEQVRDKNSRIVKSNSELATAQQQLANS